MKHTVIVGAGPIGLYLAIRLRQIGVENVLVIDPRAENYTRPGTLDKEIFAKVEKHINQEGYKLHAMVDENEMEKGFLYVEKGETENSLKCKVIDYFGNIQTDTIYASDVLELIDKVTDPLDLDLLSPLLEKILQVDSLRNHIYQPIAYSPSRHIKEVERQLFTIAKQLGVEIANKKFESFVSKPTPVSGGSEEAKENPSRYMQVSDERGEVTEIPCDLAFDASGQKRVLVTEVNERHIHKPFQVEPVFDTPIKNYFIAYGKISIEDIKLLDQLTESSSLISGNKISHTLALENLRQQFGWREFDAPRFHFRILNNGKVCIYFETPPTLDAARYGEWMDALLYLKTGKHIAFERVGEDKPTYNPFIVHPQKVPTPMYMGDTVIPPIAVVGDAQIEPHFELGVGIESGMKRADTFLKCVTIKNGEIAAIDTEQYANELRLRLMQHENGLIEHFENRQYALVKALIIERGRYSEALLEIDKSRERDNIKASLSELNTRIVEEVSRYPKLASKFLYSVVEAGDIENVRKLVERGVDVNTVYDGKDMPDATVLYLAVVNNNDEMARYLIEHGADVHQTYDGYSLLHFAVENNDEALAQLLLENDIGSDTKNDNGTAPIHIATQMGNVAMVELLLKHGAKVDVLTNEDASALHMAASVGNVKLMEVLLDHGADIDRQTYKGNTPLHYAFQHDDAIQLLLSRNADVNLENDDGETPLYQAVYTNNVSIATDLIARDADVNMRYYGNPLLHIAVEYADEEMVKLLLLNKADVNALNPSGETALYTAVSLGQLDIVRLLLEHGAEVDLEDAEADATSIQVAILTAPAGDTEILSVLLSASPTPPKNLTVNANDLLAIADDQGYKSELEAVLIEKYQEPLSGTLIELSALEFAVIVGRTDVVATLLKEADFSSYVAPAIDYANAMFNEDILIQLRAFKKSDNWATLFAEKVSAGGEKGIENNEKNIKGTLNK